MHAKYSSVTLLCIPFPFVSLRYFAYIYTHTHTYVHAFAITFVSCHWFTALLRTYSFSYDLLQISRVYTHTHLQDIIISL